MNKLTQHYVRLLLVLHTCSINFSIGLWANIHHNVTHPFKRSGQLLWQPAQTGDEIRARALALRESLSICLLTPLLSVSALWGEWGVQAEHKQQRWLNLAASQRDWPSSCWVNSVTYFCLVGWKRLAEDIEGFSLKSFFPQFRRYPNKVSFILFYWFHGSLDNKQNVFSGSRTLQFLE